MSIRFHLQNGRALNPPFHDTRLSLRGDKASLRILDRNIPPKLQPSSFSSSCAHSLKPRGSGDRRAGLRTNHPAVGLASNHVGKWLTWKWLVACHTCHMLASAASISAARNLAAGEGGLLAASGSTGRINSNTTKVCHLTSYACLLTLCKASALTSSKRPLRRPWLS